MKLAWFTPLPPMQSGISDYSYELLPLVASGADVEVFCPRPGRLRRPKAPPGLRVSPPRGFDPGRFDVVYYHLGNNPFHEFVYETALRHPGICVFHDFSLHHLIAHAMVEARSQPGRYESTLIDELGGVGGRLATLRREGIATEFEKFMFPLAGHVAQRARGLVVHSVDSGERLRAMAPEVPIRVIPHHAGSPPPEVEGIDVAEARRRLGLPLEAFLVGHFGFVTRPKQPDAVVGGFAALLRERPDARLLIVGADNTGGGLARLVQRHGVAEAAITTGYVDLLRFYLYLRAVDAVINLRYPSAGESSGTLARALAEGKAVITNNYASFSELPRNAALKVDIDRPQAEQVGRHLLRLARDGPFRAVLERRARRYATTTLAQSRCRDLYLDFAREVSSDDRRPAPVRSRPRTGPVPWADARGVHQAAEPSIERLVARSRSPDGSALFIDLVYRLLLGRPAEEPVLRHAHQKWAAGLAERRRLVRQVVESDEFREQELLERAAAEVRREGRFRLPEAPAWPGTTERVIEVPWVLSRYRGERRVLDVGYAHARDSYTTALLTLPAEELHGVDLSQAPVPTIRRTRGDLRRLPYRDASFDLVLCVSTLEHVGRDNVRYGGARERQARGDVEALVEMARVIIPGGRLLLTVPFGRVEDHGWFLQYDEDAWEGMLARTPFEVEEQEVFRLSDRGWEPVRELGAMSTVPYGLGTPAAGGVLCAALVRPSS